MDICRVLKGFIASSYSLNPGARWVKWGRAVLCAEKKGGLGFIGLRVYLGVLLDGETHILRILLLRIGALTAFIF